jgi:hypothetical protein
VKNDPVLPDVANNNGAIVLAGEVDEPGLFLVIEVVELAYDCHSHELLLAPVEYKLTAQPLEVVLFTFITENTVEAV